MARNYTSHNRKSKFIQCPRCNEKQKKSLKYCSLCGYEFSKQHKFFSIEKLHFGKKEKTLTTKVEDNTSVEYRQKITKEIAGFKRINNVVFLILGILSMLMIVMPLFTNRNIGNYINEVADVYKFSIYDGIKINESTSFVNLITGIKSYLLLSNKIFNPTFILYVYEVLVSIGIIVLFVCGLILSILAIIGFIKGKQGKNSKKIIGVILSVSSILICGLNCYGLGPIIVTLFGISVLIYLYIGGIISKEKAFIPRHLFHKSLSCILLITLLFLSALGLSEVNISIGSKIYLFQSLSNNGSAITPTIIPCRGVLLEYMQFVHSSSGDDNFKSIVFNISLITFALHAVYLCFTVFAAVSLLKSFSRPSIRFPFKKIVVATIAFYAFCIMFLIFGEIINQVSLDTYIQSIGRYAYEQLSNEAKLGIEKSSRIFKLTSGMSLSMILYLPTCIYTIIARNNCLRKIYI